MISIVIPTHNQAKHLKRLLSVLKSQISQNDLHVEVIVVDNRSTDETRVVAAQNDVRYIEYKKTQSPFAARNRGVQEATYSIIVFLDSKCIPTADYIANLKGLLKSDPWHIIAGQITPTGITERSHCFSIAYAIMQVKTDPKFFGGNASALTGNMVVKKEVFQKLGGFKVDRSGGDVEFSKMARKKGYTIKYSRNLKVTYHVKTKSEVISFLKRVSKNGQNQRTVTSLRPPNPRYINERLDDIELQLSTWRYIKLYVTVWYMRWLKYIYQYI